MPVQGVRLSPAVLPDCGCTHCRMGAPQHCTGALKELRIAKWHKAYNEAAAELVLTMCTGRLPSAAAREEFAAKVKRASATLTRGDL